MTVVRCIYSGFVERRAHNHHGSCCLCHEYHTGHYNGAALIRGCFRPKLCVNRGLAWLRLSDPQ
eukprot:1621111-Amphidinium_carterae.1